MKWTYALTAALALTLPVIFTACSTPTGGSATPTINTATSSPRATAGITATPTPSDILMSASPRPTTHPTVSAPTPTKQAVNTASIGKKRALLQLKNITIAEANYAVPYNRTKDFGPAWKDVDHNGCDTRNDILKRDLINITYRSDDPGCTVATGVLHDPYTGKTEYFVRGPHSAEQQIDHVMPLAYFWRHGAYKLSQTKREQYANDPVVLLAVDGPANEQKGDSGPADWMPSNYGYRCIYVEKFTNAIYKYNATMSRRDATKVRSVLNTCK